MGTQVTKQNGGAAAPTREAPEGNAIYAKARTLLDTLRGRQEDFERALVSRIPPQLFFQIVVNAYVDQPQLRECSEGSIFKAAMELARLGLRPDGEEAALVPYYDKEARRLNAQAQVMYQGYVRLMLRAGCRKVEAHPVFTNDHFEYSLGLDPRLDHRPPSDLTSERGQLVGAYAWAILANGERQFEVMDREELAKIRASSKAPNSPAWSEWESEMARIRPLRRLRKWVELEPAAAAAFQQADAWDAGREEPLGSFAPELGGPSLKERAEAAAASQVKQIRSRVEAAAEDADPLTREIAFGKHAGTTWRALLDSDERGYVTRWMLAQPRASLHSSVTDRLYAALEAAAAEIDARATAEPDPTEDTGEGTEDADAATSPADVGDTSEGDRLLAEAHARLVKRIDAFELDDAYRELAQELFDAGDVDALIQTHERLGRERAEAEAAKRRDPALEAARSKLLKRIESTEDASTEERGAMIADAEARYEDGDLAGLMEAYATLGRRAREADESGPEDDGQLALDD